MVSKVPGLEQNGIESIRWILRSMNELIYNIIFNFFHWALEIVSVMYNDDEKEERCKYC